VFNGVLDANVLDSFVLDGSAGKAVKGSQYGTFSFTAGLTTSTLTISTVDAEKSAVVFCQYPISELSAHKFLLKAQMASDTTVTFQSYASATSDRTVYWQVIEFKDLKSKQYGTVTASAGLSCTASVTEFDTSKAWLVHSFYRTYTAATTIIDMCGTARIESSTSLYFTNFTYGDTVYDWQLLEFK